MLLAGSGCDPSRRSSPDWDKDALSVACSLIHPSCLLHIVRSAVSLARKRHENVLSSVMNKCRCERQKYCQISCIYANVLSIQMLSRGKFLEDATNYQR